MTQELQNREKWLLAALAKADEPLTPVQLQKIMFLLGREGKPTGGFYDFIPWDYGPFSKEIYRDAERLAAYGLLSINSDRVKYYSISPPAKPEVHQIVSTLDATLLEYVERVTGWASRLTFSQLVRAIYEKYPEFKERSVFAQ